MASKFGVRWTQKQAAKLFLSFTEAKDACFTTGYEDKGLIETIFEKTRITKDLMLDRNFPLSDSACQSLLAIFIALRTGEKRLKVIDFGGACGAHYFQLRPFLPSDVQLDWTVVETPAMTEKAKAFEIGELRFVASLYEAKEKLQRVDLLHSSGALQYVPDPQATIQEFLECEPAYIFLNRLALSASGTIITIQESLLSANGPGALPNGLRDRLCHYPVTYFPKQRLEEMLSQEYQMKIEFAETKTFVGETDVFLNVGMLVERRK